MKNKKLTYLLGFLVLVVWGIIISRIFNSAAGSNEETFAPAPDTANKEPYNDYNIPKDTTHLLLNYKDPFALKKQIDTPMLSVKKTIPAKNIQPSPKLAFNWNFIKYSGYIRNHGSKNLVSVIKINGKPVMMTEGETAEQVTLVKNLQDSIKITFNGKTTYIKMQSGVL